MKRFSLVALIFCVSCSSSLAQETNACQTRDVTVNVRDSKGELMTGLQPASFRATLGRQPMRVLASNIVVSGSRVVLLLDLSASMNPEWDLVRSAANHFVVNASAPLRIGLVTFSDHIIETLNVGSSSHDIHDIIERITKPPDGKGHTSLYDSMAFAAGLFQKPLPGDAIYVFTDGGDNRSKLNRGDVERLLLSRGIRLFWFDLYDRYFPTEQGQEGYVDVEDLVKKSGGDCGDGGRRHAHKRSRVQQACQRHLRLHEKLLRVECRDSSRGGRQPCMGSTGAGRPGQEAQGHMGLLPKTPTSLRDYIASLNRTSKWDHRRPAPDRGVDRRGKAGGVGEVETEVAHPSYKIVNFTNC
jgi:hypothetical protein